MAKLFWDTMLVAAVFRAILLQFRVKFPFFSLTFHARVLNGDLKTSARNFSDKEVLESALKM